MQLTLPETLTGTVSSRMPSPPLAVAPAEWPQPLQLHTPKIVWKNVEQLIDSDLVR